MLVYAQQRNWQTTRRRRNRELTTGHGDPADRALRSVRATRPVVRRRARPSTDWVGWLKVALFATVVGVLLIWQRTQVVRVGKEVHHLHLQRRQLVDEVRDLRAAFEKATSYEVIRARAAKELGFTAPGVRVLELDDEE